jgi:hypothetical protein
MTGNLTNHFTLAVTKTDHHAVSLLSSYLGFAYGILRQNSIVLPQMCCLRKLASYSNIAIWKNIKATARNLAPVINVNTRLLES